MNYTSNQFTKHLLKVQTNNSSRMKSNIVFLKDGPSNFTSMILLISIFTIKRQELKKKEAKLIKQIELKNERELSKMFK